MWFESKPGKKNLDQHQKFKAELQRIAGNLSEEIRAQYGLLMANLKKLTSSFGLVEEIVKCLEVRILELECRVKHLEDLSVSRGELLESNPVERDSLSTEANGTAVNG